MKSLVMAYEAIDFKMAVRQSREIQKAIGFKSPSCGKFLLIRPLISAVKTSPVTRNARLHNPRHLSEKDQLKNRTVRRCAGDQEDGVCAAGKAPQFRRVPFSRCGTTRIPVQIGKTIQTDRKRLGRTVSFFRKSGGALGERLQLVRPHFHSHAID